jgi:thiol:disulfide interchange protein DsbD
MATYAKSDQSSDMSSAAGAASEQEVAWRQDAHAAMNDGRSSGKLVLFDVGASWCPNCKKMQETTYRDQTVCSQLNQNFICVELDKDDNGDGAKLCDALFIMALPTVVIVDPQTDKYVMKVGYQNATKFEAMIAKIQKNGLHNGTSGFRLTPKIYGNR